MLSIPVPIFIVLVLVALLIIGILLKRVSSRESVKIEDLDEYMRQLAEKAVDFSRESGLDLDYSLESIKKAELSLSKIHEDFIKQDDKTDVEGLAMAFGAYIGESIMRNTPDSHWEKDHPVGGPNSFTLHWKGGESFVAAWCYRRIKNGPEDNIWHKYQILSEQRDK